MNYNIISILLGNDNSTLFGIKNDVFASKVLFEELLTNFGVLLARVTALETRYNSHTQHPPPA